MIIERVREVLPEWFKDHPMVTAVKKEQQAEVVKKRQEASVELEKIQARILIGFPDLEADRESILQDIKKAEEKVVSLKEKAVKVRIDLVNRKEALERGRKAQERILLETADERIDVAIEWFRSREEDLRRPGRISTRGGHAQKNVRTWSKETHQESNYPAVCEAMDYCREAIKRLEAMRLVPQFDPAVVEVMKKSIPSTDRFTEYKGEKPIPKGPDPVFLRKKWDAVDAKIASLLNRRV